MVRRKKARWSGKDEGQLYRPTVKAKWCRSEIWAQTKRIKTPSVRSPYHRLRSPSTRLAHNSHPARHSVRSFPCQLSSCSMFGCRYFRTSPHPADVRALVPGNINHKTDMITIITCDDAAMGGYASHPQMHFCTCQLVLLP
jgi:hypothetical protein